MLRDANGAVLLAGPAFDGDAAAWSREVQALRGEVIPVTLPLRLPEVLDAVGRCAALMRARQAAAAARREVEVLNQELEAFYYSVTHDLRAPLRTIQGFCQMFLEDFQASVPPEGRALLDHVQAGAARMDRMIEELLSLSRLARQPLAPAEVDVEALARRVTDEMVAAEPQRAFEVRIGALGSCQADPDLLEQAVRRLVSNSIKFTRGREPARIEIGRRSEPAQAQSADSGSASAGLVRTVYFVRDNGAGFDMKYAGKLFGAFQRMHTQTQFEGTGVGLAGVQRIVHRHGGRIWAESAPGQGTTFYFTLAPDPA